MGYRAHISKAGEKGEKDEEARRIMLLLMTAGHEENTGVEEATRED